MQSAERVARMAREFHNREDVSMVELLKSSGYLDDPGRVSEKHIAEFFAEDPTLIADWMRESTDTRSSPAPFISSDAEQSPIPGELKRQWLVGRAAGGDVVRFDDLVSACACYVKLYVEGIRTRHFG